MAKRSYTFAAWLDRFYRKPRESKTSAVYRFAAEHGMPMPSVWYAVEGCRMSPGLAQRVEAVTDGRVTVSSLVTGPTRAAFQAARKAAREEAAHG